MFLKNKNIFFKMRRSKVTDYAALTIEKTDVRLVSYAIHEIETGDSNVMVLSLYINMVLKMLYFGSIKELEVFSVQIFWTRLASFSHLGLISDPLMVSKFHNRIHDSIGHENKAFTIFKGGRRSTTTTQSLSPAVAKSNMFLKGISFTTEQKTNGLFQL